MSIDQSLARRVVEPSPAGANTTLEVTGEIDIATSPQMRAAIEAAFAGGVTELRIDLTECEFMDSTGLHVLADATHLAREAGSTLEIVCPQGNVRRVIEIAGMADLLHLKSSD